MTPSVCCRINTRYVFLSQPPSILSHRITRLFIRPMSDDYESLISNYTTSNFQVARIKSITTSPSLLESTSLVFAYGLDLFSTRIAPSNTFDILSESFNKVQLVLTVVGLAVAILITKPIVRSKRVKERWYDS